MSTSESQPLISIIMPAYNAMRYVGAAIQSILDQEWSNWELLVVNDGSVDETESEVKKFSDARIRYFVIENGGVSAARNIGLQQMRGVFFCFLDADDLMTAKSLVSRFGVFSNESGLAFAGGAQIQMNETLEKELMVQTPNYKGRPLKGLICLDSGCFINCGTWLIKRNPAREYRFIEGWTHGEDLAFFFQIADDGKLGYTTTPSQIYRRGTSTAMANLGGLEKGYRDYFNLVKKSGKASFGELQCLKAKILKILFLSHLSYSGLLSAIRSLRNVITL